MSERDSIILVDKKSKTSYEFIQISTANSEGSTKVLITSYGNETIPSHIHEIQDESFKVLEGQLLVRIDNREIILDAGKQITLPKGKPHNHTKLGDTKLMVFQEIKPGLDFHFFVENQVNMSNKVSVWKGGDRILQSLVNLNCLESKIYSGSISKDLQSVIAKVLGPLARLLGYRAISRNSKFLKSTATNPK